MHKSNTHLLYPSSCKAGERRIQLSISMIFAHISAHKSIDLYLRLQISDGIVAQVQQLAARETCERACFDTR